MSESNEAPLNTSWTPNDYSNFITICAAAIGSTLLVLFKSRCSKISCCWGLYSCDREVLSDEEDNNNNDNNNNNNNNNNAENNNNNTNP